MGSDESCWMSGHAGPVCLCVCEIKRDSWEIFLVDSLRLQLISLAWYKYWEEWTWLCLNLTSISKGHDTLS